MKTRKGFGCVLKLTDFEYRALVVAVNNYRLRHKEMGEDTTVVSDLLRKILESE